MKMGRVVVVKQALGNHECFTLGSVTSVTSKDSPEGEGLFVQFAPETDSVFFSRESGAVHKIRDYSVEKLVDEFTGVHAPVIPQEPTLEGGDGEELEEEENEEEDEDDEDIH